MKALMMALGVALAAGAASGVSAHPGGHGPVTSERALEIASLVAGELSRRDAGLGFGQLDASWTEIEDSAKKIHAKERDYIIVSLANAKEERTLYILMSPGGEVYDANFTGEFPGLDGPPEDAPSE